MSDIQIYSSPEIPSERGKENPGGDAVPKRSRGTYPKKEAGILLTFETVIAKLEEKGWQSEMVKLATMRLRRDVFKQTLDSKILNQSEKSPSSRERERIIKETDEAPEGIKKLLQHNYKKEAPAYYGKCGIHFKNKSYRMRRSVADRIIDIETMIKGLAELNIHSDIYNAEFWQNKLNELTALSDNIISHRGGTSVDVAGMNQLKKETNTLFNYTICLIKANTPKEMWSAAIREFGFMKEFYN
jgi:hypothetical protein